MGRQPCCDKVGLKRGPWTIEEDRKLITFILNNGIHCWRTVPKLAGLQRCGKSCRLRWINYLRPDLKRGQFSEAEEGQMIQLHARIGNRWSKIASYFPGRTDNEIKNHWNTRIKKRLKILGLDPVTHTPIVQEEKEVDPNSSKVQEEKFEGHVTKKHDQKNELLFSNYEKICKSLDVELWMNQEISSSNSLSSTFSLDNYSSFSMGDSSSVQQEDSIKQWVDSVDSMLSWEAFNNEDKEFSYFGN